MKHVNPEKPVAKPEQEFNVAEATKAQSGLCRENGYPEFAPSHGVCWRCHRNIYKPEKREGYESGYTVKYASENLITGCPHCHRSYCD